MKFYLWFAAGVTAAIALSGCATLKTLAADESAKCGPGLVGAVLQSEQVLERDTTAAGALADIQNILSAAGQDVSAVWCVVQVAIDDLKAQPQKAVTASTVKGKLSTQSTLYPSDPVQRGIMLGGDVLKLKPAQ